MKTKILEIFHSITLRLPQRIALRNGMRITTYGRVSNSLFWSIFTSREYLSFIPHLLRLKVAPQVCIDCGSALGYFSLLIEHLRRSHVFNWHTFEYHLVEPMPFNYKRLQFNVKNNLKDYTVYKNAAGKKNSTVDFFFSRLVPWGGSVFKQGRLSNKISIEHLDLTKILSKGPALVKLDIEGSEFDFFDTYQNDLDQVVAIIAEWHLEYGNKDETMAKLEAKGFISVHQSLNTGNRIVELLVNKKNYN